MKEMNIPTLALHRTVVLSVTQLECPPLCRDSHPPQLFETPDPPTSVSAARQCDVLDQTTHTDEKAFKLDACLTGLIRNCM